MSADDIWGHKISSPALKQTKSAADWLKSGAALEVKIAELTSTLLAGRAAEEARDRATLAAIKTLTDALTGAGTGSLDTATVVAAIKAEGEKTRQDTLDRLTKVADALTK